MKNKMLFCLLVAIVTVCSAQDERLIKCPGYQIYKKCGTACQPTCEYRIQYCNEPCVKNCFCIDGYIRQYNQGPCIRIENCPRSPCAGDPLAEWVQCPYPCPATCQRPNPPPPKDCDIPCEPWACRCRRGTILDEETNKCVKVVNCPI